MLENFICCDQLFKRISNCKVKKFGVRSDHTAIITKFRLTLIKFNNEQQQSPVINWERIIIDDETISIFNNKLYELTKDNKILSYDYTYFNSAILISEEDTATKKRKNNQGWFHYSEIILFPVIQHRDHLLNHLISMDPLENTTMIKGELKVAQNVVNNQVYLAKAAWYTYQAKIIHSMRFTPK